MFADAWLLWRVCDDWSAAVMRAPGGVRSRVNDGAVYLIVEVARGIGASVPARDEDGTSQGPPARSRPVHRRRSGG
jgi:hypothetical protein